MITNVLYRKKENNKDYYFNYKNPNENQKKIPFINERNCSNEDIEKLSRF